MGTVARPNSKTKQIVTVAKYLGTGTSFNVSNVTGYRNFTVNNFAVEPAGGLSGSGSEGSSIAMCQGLSVGFSVSISKSYNASSGVLTASMSGSASASMGIQSGGSIGASTGNKSQSVKAWLIYQTEI